MAEIEFIQRQDFPALSIPLAPDDWPQLTAVNRRRVDAKYQLQVLIETLLIILIPLVAVSVFVSLTLFIPKWLILSLLSLWLVLSCSLLWLRIQQAKRVFYCVFPCAIQVQSGLWWQRITSMPMSRLQHVSLSQNPLEIRLGLCKIKCFSAGSGSAEIYLPGLPLATAEALRQSLLSLAVPPADAKITDDSQHD
ncbi:PH domain-containing protein [Shewanella sp. NIFS-20-20]|uniref:PH domain-containing protein n=1 Tax=Shewanella sp. NIFS-20-20 TaxID=2853806 RepID=UPI001C48B926|nr:PH domain-containing protein [Shewanella sp. NIFS-20-20]MBV7316488.1 PH domain-containing protein [Shewanella sp. NIFS-20-20]